MTLSPGTRLGSYRIIAALGAGGMGEVYAAEDARLHRQVALKVLPQEMATDPERLQRFEREAQAIAALNHPNVVTIHSVEEADGVHFLTMELIEGKPLSEIIAGRGLPLQKFNGLAGPLVDAVCAAHEHGVVHRDLKPANVMVTTDGRVKVLDFGLAKLQPELYGAASASMMTTAAELTAAHVKIMGTAAYMSPEQAEGHAVDHRSDLFSLGVVLYEMLTGTRPFTGDTSVSIISAILKDTPRAITEINPALPGDLDRIIRRCLAKEPAHRYQTARDLRHDLEQAAARTRTGAVAGVARAAAGALRRHARWLTLLAVGTAVVAAAVFAWRSRTPGPAPPLRVTFSQLTGFPGVEQYPSLSPDGQWVIYAGEASGNKDIYLQAVGGQNPMNLTPDSPESDDEPVFSPDGQRIAFRSEREGGGIFVMGRTGEAVRRVTRKGFNPSWSPDGKQLAFTTENVQVTPLNREGGGRELWVVSVESGELRQIAVPEAVQPHWSPHGQRIAYGVWHTKSGQMDIATVPAQGGPPVPVTQDAAADWSPAWAPDGKYLYFASNRQGSMNLWRVPVDEASGKVLGEPEPITTPAQMVAHPSVSADGKHIAFSSVLMTQNLQVVNVDPATQTVKGEPAWVTTGSRQWSSPDFSPDGQWLVFYSRTQPEGQLYVIRSDGTALRQLTGGPAMDRVPRWSPDGTWITSFSTRSAPIQVWKVHPDGSGLEQVSNRGRLTSMVAWAPDASRLTASSEPDNEVYVLDPNRPAAQQLSQVLPTPPAEMSPFLANSWARDGERLAGQISYAAHGIVTYAFRTGTYDKFTDYGEYPVWFPDSRHVLFVSKGKDFLVLDTKTREVRTIFSVTRDVIGPPRLSRDGRKACFSRRVTEADLWLVSLQ